MSRIGKLPITIPQGVTISVSPENVITVKGKHGELSQQMSDSIKVTIEDSELIVSRNGDAPDQRSAHGLYRALISNMITGVSAMFSKKMEVIGVGYRAAATGQMLELSLGYSHPILFQMPPEIKLLVEQEKRANAFITLQCHDKQLLGQVAAKVRSYRAPEPYKGKGVRYVDETVRVKEGKKSGDK